MLNSTLIRILKSFSPDDLSEFSDYINSPYHNKKSGAVLLYNNLLKFSPEFKDNNLSRKLFWKILYPGKEFNYGIIKNLIYDLTRLCENFIVQKRFEADIFHRKSELISALYDRNLKELFGSKFKSFENSALSESFSGNVVREDFYYYMWRSYSSKWSFENSILHLKDYTNNIELSSDYFIACFFIHSFILYHNIEAQKTEHNYSGEEVSVKLFLKNADKTGLISDVLRSVSKTSVETSKVLDTYYKMFSSVIHHDSKEYYYEFKNTLERNKLLFSAKDLLALYITLLNCLTFLESKEIFKQEESLAIYDSMIESKIFFSDNGRVWDQDFLSYITTAANLGKDRSIELFINKVLTKLQSDDKENMLSFANAFFFFLKGDYGKSQEYIASTQLDLFQMKFYLKNLQLKIYYELDDFDSFEYAVDSYHHFLNKNKTVSERWKTAMKSFCSNVRTLFKMKYNFNEYEYYKFRSELISKTGYRKIWIINKIDELGKMNNAKI